MSLVTVGLITFAVAGCSDGSDSGRADRLVAYTEAVFLNPISKETALDIVQNDETVDLEVFLSDGSSKIVTFEIRLSPSHPYGDDKLKPANNEDRDFLVKNQWYPNAKNQFKLYAESVIFPSLEQTYGIALNTEQREALQMPNKIPTELSKYGSTDILIAQPDGTFYNGPVTLIWDDTAKSFKLIYSQGSGVETEIPQGSN